MQKKLQILSCLLLLIFLGSCSIGTKTYKIGVDPDFLTEDLGDLSAHVLGYIQDFMMETSRREKVRFELVYYDSYTLFSKLEEEKCDAIISSLDPYNFNEAAYDFSEPLLYIGPVFLVPEGSKIRSFDALHDELIGVLLKNSYPSLSKKPDLILRPYMRVLELITALSDQEIEGAIMPRFEAAKYTGQSLPTKIISLDKPLTDKNFRLLTKDDEEGRLLRVINRSLQDLRKRKELKKLEKKWQLS